MGTFSFSGIQFGRKIYQQDNGGRNFLYFWDYGPNAGANWMIGLDPTRKPRGIESANVENSTYLNICADDANKVGPFKSWNRRNESWDEDWSLRLECYDHTVDCCDKVAVQSSGSALFYHKDKLGTYDFFAGKNGRSLYKQKDGEHFLFFNDWGALRGSNWMIAPESDSIAGPIISQNLEFSPKNVCSTDSARAGPFLVLTPSGWEVDASIKVKCQVFHDEENEKVKEWYAA